MPVIKNGTRPNIDDATLKRSHLWTNTSLIRLTTNMRAYLTHDTESASYSQLLMRIGNGEYPLSNSPDSITLPDKIVCSGTYDDFVDDIYGDLAQKAADTDWLPERAILAPLNETVN